MTLTILFTIFFGTLPLRTYGLIGVGARDDWASKKNTTLFGQISVNKDISGKRYFKNGNSGRLCLPDTHTTKNEKIMIFLRRPVKISPRAGGVAKTLGAACKSL